ncbi:L,D-transpeptidase family protein [Demequina aurantiaca]|uniref:L,D-transpeptidase family protein n=1 Tax=Demequina aurantiaca TaxID=676200 RepID=UPI003D34F8BC
MFIQRHLLVIPLGFALLLAGCSSSIPELAATATAVPTPVATPISDAPSPSPSATVAINTAGQVATVLGDSIVPLDAPDGEPVTELTNPMREGVPLVFYVVQQDGDWIEVQLPIRPNGATGWVRASDVTLNSLTYALTASIDDRTVTLTKDGEEVRTFDVAIGTGDTPTPTGDFFITELLIPTNEGYGPYAFGLSAFSDVLNSFGGGPGQIGLHGTPDADSIGRAASHGCIRLYNEDITYLAEILPLGTPITIA